MEIEDKRDITGQDNCWKDLANLLVVRLQGAIGTWAGRRLVQDGAESYTYRMVGISFYFDGQMLKYVFEWGLRLKIQIKAKILESSGLISILGLIQSLKMVSENKEIYDFPAVSLSKSLMRKSTASGLAPRSSMNANRHNILWKEHYWQQVVRWGALY